MKPYVVENKTLVVRPLQNMETDTDIIYVGTKEECDIYVNHVTQIT